LARRLSGVGWPGRRYRGLVRLPLVAGSLRQVAAGVGPGVSAAAVAPCASAVPPARAPRRKLSAGCWCGLQSVSLARGLWRLVSCPPCLPPPCLRARPQSRPHQQPAERRHGNTPGRRPASARPPAAPRSLSLSAAPARGGSVGRGPCPLGCVAVASFGWLLVRAWVCFAGPGVVAWCVWAWFSRPGRPVHLGWRWRWCVRGWWCGWARFRVRRVSRGPGCWVRCGSGRVWVGLPGVGRGAGRGG